MTQQGRTEYLAVMRGRYQRASRAAKGRLLDEICRTTRLHRKAAIRALRRPARAGRARGGRPRRYGPELGPSLTRVWELSDRLCGKLLVPLLPTLLAALERHQALTLPPPTRAALLSLSPAPADRLLRPARQQWGRQPRRGGRGLSPFAARVPIRTWRDWGDAAPGALQADLVLHCGESTAGFFLCTLVAVDVATGWVDLEPVWGLSQRRVRSAIAQLHRRLPFPLRQWHTDNGGEFLNAAVLDYCRQHQITVTRGRAYRKNDQAWVEQRNWLAVRRVIGRDRFASRAAYSVLGCLYALLRVQLNYLRPLRRLVLKRRVGSRTVKRYDTPRTPAQRVLATNVLTPAQQAQLTEQALALNPARLVPQLQATLATLWKLAELPSGRRQDAASP